MEKQDNKPLISIIVPIYNVEAYLRKCLDSLKNQTLRQVEIICIDDGSTDNSGKIAEEYNSEGWPKFRVIHTDNRGLSAARNRGIDEAKSEWLMFVDADDWVDKNFCEIPYETALNNQADLIIFRITQVAENGRMKWKKQKAIEKRTSIVDHETAIDLGVAVWDKLYKRFLYMGICYPEGHVYEEIAITHLLIYRASRIVSIPEQLYYYRFRDGSISRNISNDIDYFSMSKKRYKDLIQLGYPLEKANAILCAAALRCCGRSENIVCSEASEILKTFRKVPKGLSSKDKFKMTLWKTSETIYRLIYRIVK